MGKVLFYVGLAILLFGQGPILLLGKLDSSNPTGYVLLTLGNRLGKCYMAVMKLCFAELYIRTTYDTLREV